MINKLFNDLVAEMWALKDSKSIIDTKKLISFSDKYFNTLNLVLDLINHNIIKDKEKGLSLSGYNETIIDFFKKINKTEYNRLIIDTLMELDSDEAINYLVDIINSSNSLDKFKDDFMHHPKYDNIIEKISQEETII